MSLSSNSTLEEVLAAYRDNADYDLVGSIAKARQYIIACRMLLVMLTGDSTFSESRTVNTVNVTQVRQELARAQDWHAASGGNTSAGGVTFASFENFR